jgi:hypothetical protein
MKNYENSADKIGKLEEIYCWVNKFFFVCSKIMNQILIKNFA